jgi:HD-GYP domain-containing protein (c-di-GMP phosphodiesterase class II)
LTKIVRVCTKKFYKFILAQYIAQLQQTNGGGFINTFNENRAVGRMTELIALEYGFDPASAGQIRVAASLHDVGKLRIPREILDKPGELTAQEFSIVKTHTAEGAEMLKPIQGALGKIAREICLLHHENYSGTGYYGKHTDELPVYIQFVGIADIFTALVSQRSYKEPWPHIEAVDYIQRNTHTLFAPELVSVVLHLVRNDKRVLEIYGEAVSF